MKLGFSIAQYDWPGAPDNTAEVLKEVAKAGEKGGFSSIWVMDHFFQLEEMVGPADDPMNEAYTTLGFLAGNTSKVNLGTLVSGNIYRNPGLLVKAMTTLDIISGGRGYFGVGTGWYEKEAKGLGFPFPPWKERFEMLEETLKIAKKMWSDDRTPFEGKHYQLGEPICSPQPITKPHPPIMIGGSGEKITLRLVAEYGDACNLFAMGPDANIPHKLDVLRKHCVNAGRDYDDIEKSVLTMSHFPNVPLEPAKVIGMCQGLAKAGIDHAIMVIPEFHNIEVLEVFGEEIIPAVAEL